MNKNDFSDLENQIVSKVSDAFKAIDVANLKKDINYKAEGTINQFKVNFNECNKKNKQNISNNFILYCTNDSRIKFLS